MNHSALKLTFFTLSVICAPTSFAASSPMNKDPYETFNRHAFALNETVDKVVYRPIANVYQTVTPNIVQRGITNFFDNIGTVPTLANDVLQGKIYQGTQDAWRLFFNTTFGLLGIFDIASKIGLPPHHEDFGMTLSRWGYENSNYFVIPFLGPSTVRDSVGLAVDLRYLSVYSYMNNIALRNSLIGLNFVQTRAELLQYQDVADIASFDPYAFQRNAYLQRRTFVLKLNRQEDATVESQKLGNPSSNDSNNDPYVEE